jgi:hypothetical protein
VEEAFWPVACRAAEPLAEAQKIGPTDLLFTPNPGPDAQLSFLGSKLQITDLTVTGAYEIRLWPRCSQSHNELNLEIRGGQSQLWLEMLSDTVRIQTQEYQVKARDVGQIVALTQDCLGFRPRADARSALISGSGSWALIFYNLRDLDPVNDDLLELPMRVEAVNCYDAEKGADGNAYEVEAECVALNVGDKAKPEWRDRRVRIRKNDLSHFELLKVRTLRPGRLHVALRGETGSFHAGVGKKLENQTPSALSHLEAKIGLLLAVLLELGILFLTLKDRLSKEHKRVEPSCQGVVHYDL